MTQQKPRRKQTNTLRIIGGNWRGRKLEFPDLAGLRPTTDRVRETVFNWLQQDIIGSRCLDLFAGSGALGLEALSREAGSVTFVDTQFDAISFLKKNIATLGANNACLKKQDALKFLTSATENSFDIVFLDPPFHKNLLSGCIQLLSENKIVGEGALIYIEVEKDADPILLPDHWDLLKEKKAGQVIYQLAVVRSGE